MWRNKDWNNPHNVYELHPLHSQIEDDRLHRAYEEGADAILKAIQTELIVCSSTFDTLNVIETIFRASVYKTEREGGK